MCHRRRMRDQTLNTSQRFCEGETLKCVDELLHAIDSTVYFEAHHCAEAGLLRRGNAVPWMRAQARIVDTLYTGVVAQQLHHACGVLTVDAHPRMKCPHPSPREKAVEGGARYSEAVRPPGQLLNERGVSCHDRAADDVAVSVEVLGGRVDHEVSPELGRPLQHR